MVNLSAPSLVRKYERNSIGFSEQPLNFKDTNKGGLVSSFNSVLENSLYGIDELN